MSVVSATNIKYAFDLVESPSVSRQRRAVTLLPTKLTERAAIFQISDSVNSYLRLCREQLTKSEDDEDTLLVTVSPSTVDVNG